MRDKATYSVIRLSKNPYKKEGICEDKSYENEQARPSLQIMILKNILSQYMAFQCLYRQAESFAGAWGK